MKRTIVSILSLLFFLISKAQVAEFLSLQSATSGKDSKGDFIEAKVWIGQETYIYFDLSQKKVQFFSKGMLDRDTFSLKKEIFLNEGTSPDIVNDKMMWNFLGTDKTGKQCTVRLKLIRDEFKIQDGELRVEFLGRAEIYKIRTFRHNPRSNKS